MLKNKRNKRRISKFEIFEFGDTSIEISNLENIKIIDLRGNKLTDISILKDLTSIISLDLRGNKITHLPQFLLQGGAD